MRVVLDANIWVSAAIRTGPAHRIVQAWLAGSASLDVVICPALIAEVEEVLTQRPRMRKWIALDVAGHFVAASGKERQRAASSVRVVRQLPFFAASCRVLPPDTGTGR